MSFLPWIIFYNIKKMYLYVPIGIIIIIIIIIIYGIWIRYIFKFSNSKYIGTYFIMRKASNPLPIYYYIVNS